MPAEALRDLIADTEREVRVRVERLAAIRSGHPRLDRVAGDAHDLRSLGGNFGLRELADCARTVERAARAGCAETVSASLPPLVAAGGRALAALRARPELRGRGIA